MVGLKIQVVEYVWYGGLSAGRALSPGMNRPRVNVSLIHRVRSRRLTCSTVTGHLTPSWSHRAVIPLFIAIKPVRWVNGDHFEGVVEGEAGGGRVDVDASGCGGRAVAVARFRRDTEAAHDAMADLSRRGMA